MSRYVVAEATQVNADGKVHGAGETVDLDDETAAPLVASGTVTPAGDKAKARKKAS